MVESSHENHRGHTGPGLPPPQNQRGCSVKELVLRGVKAELEGGKPARKAQAATLPIIDSKRPGWLRLTNQQINEILFP